MLSFFTALQISKFMLRLFVIVEIIFSMEPLRDGWVNSFRDEGSFSTSVFNLKQLEISIYISLRLT